MPEICKFFSNGHCRFGDKCWNVHQEPNNQRSASFNQRGDYYVSNNNRSLWRSETSSPTTSNVKFSFNQALQNQNKTSSHRYSDDQQMDDFNAAPSYNRPDVSHYNRQDSASSYNRQETAPSYNRQDVGHYDRSRFSLNHLSNKVDSKYDNLFRSTPKQSTIAAANAFSFAAPVKQEQHPRVSFNSASDIDASHMTTTKTLFGKPVVDNAFQHSGHFRAQQTIFQAASNKPEVKAKSILIESGWLKKYACALYTKIEDLNSVEKESYTANIFKLGGIPVKPPPQELCH